jgi:hypothetical protein
MGKGAWLLAFTLVDLLLIGEITRRSNHLVYAKNMFLQYHTQCTTRTFDVPLGKKVTLDRTVLSYDANGVDIGAKHIGVETGGKYLLEVNDIFYVFTPLPQELAVEETRCESSTVENLVPFG